MTDLIIFTDLDGTLLDHETYDYGPAQEALSLIREKNIPLIFATSKTAAEVLALMPEVVSHWPAIVENGAGIWIPETARDFVLAADEPLESRAMPYETVLQILDGVPPHLRQNFLGFSDMTVEEIAELTGLDVDAAKRAKARDWSEPGLWRGSEEALEDFDRWLGKEGLRMIQGGRFVHLLAETSKAEQMAVLADAFRKRSTEGKVVTAALGDAPNDREMLEAADYGFVIPNPSGKSMPELIGESSGKIKRMDFPGPKGWNAAILDLLGRMGMV